MNQDKRRMPTFTKKDVARKVAEVTSERVYLAEKWTDSVFTALREIMTSADPQLRIEVRDFGVFEVKLTKSKPKAQSDSVKIEHAAVIRGMAIDLARMRSTRP